MYVYRNLEKKISPFLKRKEVVAVIGPRQSGKTTFIEHLGEELKSRKKKVKYLTFENRNDLDLFQTGIDDFKELARQYDYIIIDEFQYAKDGGQKLKYLYDSLKTKFIISGSSSLELTFGTGKYLVGRLLNFKLMPFAFREFLSCKNQELFKLLEAKILSASLLRFDVKNGFSRQINQRLAESLEKYLIYGGYPAVVLSATESEKQKILEGIVSNYLLRDIKTLLNLATDDELIKLSKFLATQIGGIIKYEELSRSSGLNYQGIIKHLNILENTFVIKLIKPFFTNRRTELVKNPKNYFVDLGLRNYLINDYRLLKTRNDLGAIMENYAHNLLQELSFAPVLKYWRTKSKAEVDFIIEKEQKVYPVEVKYSSNPIIGKSLHSFIEKFNPPEAIILTKDYLAEEKIKKSKIKFLPLSYF